MKTLLAIPSKNRIEVFAKNAYPWVKNLIKANIVVFVEPQDAKKYIDAFPDMPIYVLLENDKGLGYAKRMIQKYAEENGYDIIFKIDDDTKGFSDFRKVLKGEDSSMFIEKKIADFQGEFEKHPNLGAIALPYSFHMFDEKRKFQLAKKVQSTYFVRTKLFTTPYDFSTFEDFSVGLYCLTQGYKIIKACHVGQVVGVPVGKGNGGCNDFDRKAQALKEMEWLRKIYPPLGFKRVEKPWEIEPDMLSIKL